MIAVPLARLRVMPPMGAPVLVGGESYVFDCAEAGRLRVSCRNWSARSAPVALVDLDLSAPTTARIDGATVAATMLAEAAGLDVSQGVVWSADSDDPFGWGRGAVIVRAATGSAIRRYSEPTDATDPREILAAVLVAVLGVTP